MAPIRVTDVVQVCVVVRDLDASVRTYYDDYGIGPWAIYAFNPETVDDLRQGGEPVETAWRLAIAQVGSMMWELIQPLDDRSTYARFLAEHGEGVHHVAVGVDSFENATAAARNRGMAWRIWSSGPNRYSAMIANPVTVLRSSETCDGTT